MSEIVGSVQSSGSLELQQGYFYYALKKDLPFAFLLTYQAFKSQEGGFLEPSGAGFQSVPWVLSIIEVIFWSFKRIQNV